MLKAIIVVPCYNEAKRLDLKVFAETLRQSPWLGFLFVNDGSRDQTLSLITNFAKNFPAQAGVLSDRVNHGKASAIQRGISTAIKYRPDYVGFWDADLATPLSEIAAFCQILDQRNDISVVVGTRLSLLGHQVQRKTARRILGQVFSAVASLVLSIPIRDTQCGAKLFRVDSQIESVFEDPFCSKWILDVEVFARMVLSQQLSTGPPVAEIIYEKPLESWFEVPGSKLRARDFVKAVYELGMIYWRYMGPFKRMEVSQQTGPTTIPIGMFRNGVPQRVIGSQRRDAA